MRAIQAVSVLVTVELMENMLISFLGDGNKENPGVEIHLKKFYRQIPEGESTWVRLIYAVKYHYF